MTIPCQQLLSFNEAWCTPSPTCSRTRSTRYRNRPSPDLRPSVEPLPCARPRHADPLRGSRSSTECRLPLTLSQRTAVSRGPLTRRLNHFLADTPRHAAARKATVHPTGTRRPGAADAGPGTATGSTRRSCSRTHADPVQQPAAPHRTCNRRLNHFLADTPRHAAARKATVQPRHSPHPNTGLTPQPSR